ncbi:homeotic protein labial-like [Teleopsis dalmanni]|uniref:homeotic protein labial-like n=1 Tax=Teleopsis dalmanni TaxID=139649 RepID=UPI0018CCC0B2|nr:homeotic protein labial-like [Teleopsis dalmanni]
MMDVSSMYGNHHHHTNNYHSSSTEMAAVAAATAAASNGYTNTYFPANAAMPTHPHSHQNQHQHGHHFGYTNYDGASPNYYQQHQHQLTPPPTTVQISTTTAVNNVQQQQQQSLYSHHSHLFSPSAAEYGITTSSSASGGTSNTPLHPTSHSPTESYYESDSVQSYYATAAVATVPPSTNSPVTAANAAHNPTAPVDPPIISSENGLSYTNLDCLYNQSQTVAQQQHGYPALPVNTGTNVEEKYAAVLHSAYGGAGLVIDDPLMQMSAGQQHSPTQIWHHQHINNPYPPTIDGGLTMESLTSMHSHVHHNMHPHMQQAAQQSLQQQQSQLSHHGSTSSGTCNNSRHQHVISPNSSSQASSSSISTNQNSPQTNKSPNHSSNLPTYKWMQVKRNIPKPQGEFCSKNVLFIYHIFSELYSSKLLNFSLGDVKQAIQQMTEKFESNTADLSSNFDSQIATLTSKREICELKEQIGNVSLKPKG